MSDMSDVIKSLGRIEGIVEGIDKRLDSGSKRMDGHDRRLGKMEGRLSWFAGAWGMAGTAAGAFLVWIKSH